MIQIQLNNENLDLYSNTTIEVNLVNPIFSEKGFIPGSYSIPFSLPVTDKNNRLLNYPAIVENEERWTTYQNVVLKFQGLPYKHGTLKVREAKTKTSLECFFTFGISEIADKLKSKKLKDYTNEFFDYGANGTLEKFVNINVSGDTSGKKRVTVIINDTPVFYEFYSTSPLSRVFVAQQMVIAVNNAALGNIRAREINNSTRFTIYVEKELGIEHFSERFKIQTPDQAANQDGEMKDNPLVYDTDYTSDVAQYQTNYIRQYLYNVPDNKLRFPVFLDRARRVGNWHSSVVNSYLNGEPEVNRASLNNDYSFPYYNKTVITPCMLVSYFLQKDFGIENYAGEFDSDWFKALIFVPEKFMAINEEQYLNKQNYINNLPYFNLQDITPDYTLADFFKSIQRTFNLLIEYDSNTKTLTATKKEDYITNTNYIDITTKSSEYTNLKKSEVKGFALIRDTALANTSTAAEHHNPYIGQRLGNGELTNTIDFTSIINTFNISLPNGTTLPVTTLMDREDTSEVNFRLGFYHGVRNDNNGYPYPYMRQNYGGIDLSIRNTDGLYNVFWKNWAIFLINRSSSTRKVNFNIVDLLNFDFKTKHRIDRVDYFVKSLRTTLTMNGIKSSTLELYSIDTSNNQNTIENN